MRTSRLSWVLAMSLLGALPAQGQDRGDPDSRRDEMERQRHSQWLVSARIAAIEMFHSLYGATVARWVQSIVAPTGMNAFLASSTVTVLPGDVLQVQLDVQWQGGVIGRTYVTRVQWRLTESQHLAAVVVGDEGLFGTNDVRREHLDRYFRGTVYPALLAELD